MNRIPSIPGIAGGSARTLLVGAALLILGSAPTLALDNAYTWATGFAGRGFDNDVHAAVSFGGDLVVGGQFKTHSGQTMPTVARWDGNSWHAMGNPGWVFTESLVEFQGELYAHGFWGSSFIARHFLKWNGSSWESIAIFQPGYLGVARVLVVYDGKLIIAGDVGINGFFDIFAYDGTNFIGVGNGPDGDIAELQEYGGDLYAVGSFTALLDGTPASGIARWDGTDWYPVEGRSVPAGPLVEGLHLGANNGLGYCMTVHDDRLIIGGEFDEAGDLPVGNLVAWDALTQMWIDIGSSPEQVTQLASYDGALYAGGDFEVIGAVAANHFARWDGSSWSPVGEGFDSPPRELYVHDGHLLAPGDYRSAGPVRVERLAWWDGTEFSARLDPGGEGLDGLVRDFAVHDGFLYAAGLFEYAGDLKVDRIARWNGVVWSDLDGGANAEVRALLPYGGDLIAIGDFTEIGGIAANHVARWDGADWHPYGSGLPSPGTAICEHGGELHVGGGAYPVPAYLQRWDGASWQDLTVHEDMTSVDALASYGGDLVVGSSYFNFDPPFTFVARFDGTDWHPMLSSAGYSVDNGLVNFAQMGGELYMCGSFFYVENEHPYGGWTEAHTAHWDGSLLHRMEPISLESTISGQELQSTRDIVEWDGKIFIGGGGNYAGGHIYSWDGVQAKWQLVGGDVNARIYTMAAYKGDLYLGGIFTQVGTNSLGGTPSASIARLSLAVTDVPPSRARSLVLEQNRPNPFNPVTTIHFEAPEAAGMVTLSVHDAAGRLVRVLHSGNVEGGEADVQWDGTDASGARVASGNYLYRLTAGGHEVARKMVLLK